MLRLAVVQYSRRFPEEVFEKPRRRFCRGFQKEGARGGEGHATRAVMRGRKRCSHGKEKHLCAECSPCPHGKLKYSCVDCNPCPHGKRKRNCADCKGCPHGKVKYDCVDCKGCPQQGEAALRGLHPLPAWQAEERLRGLQPLPT